jgi:hypothetical protein
MSRSGRNQAARNNLWQWGVGAFVLAVVLMGARSVPASSPKEVDPTGRYLVDGDGKPFFWLGDTAWNLFQIPNREDAELYLSTRAKQGFTVIQAAIVMGEERVAGTARPNAYGDTAFTDNDPAKPRRTPGNNPGNAEEYDYWDHADYVIDRAQTHGLTMGILPLFVGWRGDGYKYLKVSNAYAYGKFLGERYGAKPHIVWLLGGDNVADTEEKRTLWGLVAKGITEAVAGTEDYSKTVMTYHCPGGNSSSNWFHAAPWLDFHMIQTWGSYKTIPARIAADYKLTPPKPTGLGEGAYENGNQYKWTVNALTIRQQAYWSYLSGGYHTYGNTDVWNFSSYKGEAFEDWKLALHSPGAKHLGVLRKIFDSLDWWKLVPDPAVLAGQTEALALRSTAGDAILIYLSSPAAVSVRMDKITAAGSVEATWIDPRNGARTQTGTFPDKGTASFSPPGGWEDALLLLKPAGR